MNWKMMLVMAAILAGASLFATISVYLIERGLHPAWVVGVLFVAAILAAGTLIK